MKVLILSDDPDFKSLMANYLAGKGQEISTAANLAEALRLISTNTPEFVLLDQGAVESPEEACEEIGKLAPGVTITLC